MLRLLSDENVNCDSIKALFRRDPTLDLERVQDHGLMATDDRIILEWCARENRVFLTRDRDTVPGFARERVRAGLPMPGVIVYNEKASIRRLVDEIIVTVHCTDMHEWEGLVAFIS